MLAFLQSELVPSIPLAEWTESAVDWITDNFDWFFDPLDSVIDLVVGSLEYVLLAPPALLMVAILGVIAFLLAGWRVALFTVLGLLFVISLGLWEAAVQTLALVFPATVIFAMPPAVRLTMLGIQQVPKDTVEAAHAFGATPWQTLVKVELPLSLKTIMAGVNQVIMLSLSMVVIAGLAGAGGLGEPVVTGLSQLDVGLSFVGGVGIVVIAIMLDRVTRAMADRDRGSTSKIFSRGKRSGRTAPEGETA